MQTIGNTKSNAIYESCIEQHPEGTRPTKPTQEEANAFIELKYALKRFTAPPSAKEEGKDVETEAGEEDTGEALVEEKEQAEVANETEGKEAPVGAAHAGQKKESSAVEGNV